jgi:protein involved in polysaccharide export with SLBB domain
MKTRAVLVLALTSLVLADVGTVWAQNFGSQGGSADCSSPLGANLPQCQTQTPMTGMNLNLSGSTPSAGLQPTGNLPNYTDMGQAGGQYYPMGGQYYPMTGLNPATYAPGPLTEFQKFVASTTGQILPIYGASLFQNVPTTFAPLNMTPVPPNYTIAPGDELRVRIWGQVNLQANVVVDRSGDIYLPQVGEVEVAGLPYSQLHEHLRAAVGRVYKNFNLTAELGQIGSIQVYVTGAARRPGVYTISSLSTLIDALFASGGPSPMGSLRQIQVRRGGKKIADFDLYNLLIHGDRKGDVHLQSGDVIFIPPVGAQVAITGSVKDPAIYELLPGETLAGALADAGGVSAVAAEKQVSIERINHHRDRYAMQVSYDKAGLETRLHDGDLVRIVPILPKYQETVILRGNTANPGRFAWHPGMRLSDLIPDKASLITRNYWWRRAQLGMQTPEFVPLQNFPGLRQPNEAVELPRGQLLNPSAIRPGWVTPEAQAAGVQPGPAQLAQMGQMEQLRRMGEAGQNPSNAQTGGTGPYGSNSNGSNSYGNYGSGYSNMSSPIEGGSQGFEVMPSQGGGNAGGNQNGGNAMGNRRFASMSRLSQRLMETVNNPVAPEIDWSYAVIQRQNPKTLKDELIPFDLGKLVLQHDPSQNLLLEPGDVVTIFSQANIQVPLGQQTKIVDLEGEFARAGVYTVKPGETLQELVKQAGGLSPDAYLYGSQFTRRSTRELQQRRMDDYLASLQLRMTQGDMALESSAVSSGHSLTANGGGTSIDQQMLAQLKQMRATGRIVLDLRPGSRGVAALPDITLENGDRFVVPPIPATVNVVGAVYDQNSFLYDKGARVGEYLRLAGGPEEGADRKAAFVIRANGSVVSRAASNSIWGNDFDSLRVYPGDTIVVPQKILKPSALAGLMNWSGLFSQFALGAASLSIIHY